MANLSYLATGDVKTAFEFNRKALVGQGWKELPNSSVTDQSASAMFSRNGFVVYVSVTPTGDGSLSVRLQNQGNVKPGKLPVPPNAKPVYVGDSTAMYATEAAVAATADACRNLFVAQGWVPYGDAGDSAMFKQNANLVTATVSSAPAQGGKTMIQYSNQLISADIPAPPNVEDLRYVDEPPELTFAAANQDAVVDFYRKTLATSGWKSTMDHTVDVDEKPTMIFRNPGERYADPSGHRRAARQAPFLGSFSKRGGNRRARSQNKRGGSQAARRRGSESSEERPPSWPKGTRCRKSPVTLPADAKVVKQTKDEIKFTVGKGKAKAAVESLRTQFREAGWKEDVASVTGMSGVVSVSKEGGPSATITYTDTGFLPTELSVSAMRAELEAAK